MGTKTLLNAVNEVLKRTSSIDSGGVLSSLTDSSRQPWVDIAVQVWNEIMDELYSTAQLSKPQQLASSTISLVTSTRAYAVAADFVVFRREYHLYDSTNDHYIFMLGEGGYNSAILNDPDEDDTGLASHAAIRPTDGKIYLNRTPTSNENGRSYTYRYDKDLELTSASDTFPFTDAVFRALVAPASELWKLEAHNEFRPEVYNWGVGRAARLLREIPPRESWAPVRVLDHSSTDPLDAA